MASSSQPPPPFVVQLFYGGDVSYTQGVVACAPGTNSTTFLVMNRMSYTDFVDIICQWVQIDRESSCPELTLLYQFNDVSYKSLVNGENSMELIYQLASLLHPYTCNIHVTWTLVVPTLQQGGSMNLLHAGSSHVYQEDEGSEEDEEVKVTKESEASISDYQSE